MKVSGFSFIRNGQKFGYPFVEAIKSILPICDDFYIAVGNSDDETLDIVKSIDPQKIKIIETVWDDSLRAGGQVLAVETNKAFKAIPKDTDWAFYIQGDEVVHEQYHDTILNAMKKWENDEKVDGLLFKYLHFYGSYDYIGSSEKWYPREIRVIKNNKNIYSYRDAQGFRKDNNQKLRVKPIEAYIFHYGWVKDPRTQNAKIENFVRLYHSDEKLAKLNQLKVDEFDYSGIDSLALFEGTHPIVMEDLISKKNWTFDYDLSWNKVTLKSRFKRIVKRLTGIEIGYKNYKIV
jgi:hypothetical protein